MAGRWLTDPFLVFDTETDGVDPAEARVVQLGAAHFQPLTFSHRDVRTYRSLVDPGRPIDPESTKIHRITDEDVRGAEPFAGVAGRLAQRLAGVQLVAFNGVAYDVPLLNAEFARSGHPMRLDPSVVLDVIIFARWHLRHLKSNLGDLCALYEVELKEAHSAAADAKATGDLLLRFVAEGLIPEDPAEALAQQATIAPLLAEEWGRFSYWLYQDRKVPGLLRLGCGKHHGVPLDVVDPGYCRFFLDKGIELPPEVRRLFADRAGIPPEVAAHA